MAQLLFGLASFLSPLAYSALVLQLRQDGTERGWLTSLLAGVVPTDLPWVSLYWLFAATTVVMIAVVLSARFPPVEVKEDERTGSLRTYAKLLRSPLVIAYFIGILAYVGSEQGVANWISQFLLTYHGYDPQTVGA